MADSATQLPYETPDDIVRAAYFCIELVRFGFGFESKVIDNRGSRVFVITYSGGF